jgi:Domain of unknown function (DUF4383)
MAKPDTLIVDGHALNRRRLVELRRRQLEAWREQCRQPTLFETKDGMYFGIFMVNTPHNILHIASGVMFLAAGARLARSWFHLYAAIAGMGFVVGDGMICGIISNNLYDAWGHTGLASH